MEKSKTSSALGAGIVGTALGVALGATTVALSNKQNRKKLLKTVDDVKKQTAKKVDNLKKMSVMRTNGKSNGKHMGNGKVMKAKKAIKKKVS